MKTKPFNKVCCIVAILLFMIFGEHGEATAQKAQPLFTDAEQDWLEQKHTVRVRVGNWPPFMFTDGDIRGISVDYIEKIFSHHEIDYQFISDKQVPWKSALEDIKNHQTVDLILTAKITESRKNYLIFTDEYLSLPWVIFSRVDSPFIGGMDDLAGKSVSIQDGYVMEDLLAENYPKINLQVISGDNLTERCIKALALGEVDAYVGNLAVGSYIIQSKGYNNVKIAAPTPFDNHNQAMAIRNDWPELASIINKTLTNFTSADHSAIRNKWLSVRYEHGIRLLDVLLWTMVVASVSVAIIAVIVFWNRRLNNEISERKRIEEKLRLSESQYRALSDAAFEGIAISREGILIQVNNAFARMIGTEKEALIGKKIIDLIPDVDKNKVSDKISEGYDLPYETFCMRKEGSVFPVEVQAKLYSYKGEPVRVAAIRDLTQKKQSEAEIKKLRGILPICSHCKKIRDDQGYWKQIEEYIRSHSEAEFSHGICEDCAKKFYPDFSLYDDEL